MISSIYSLDEKEAIQTGDSVTPEALSKTREFFSKKKDLVYSLANYNAAIFCHDSTGSQKFYEHRFYCHNPMNDCFRPGATMFFTLLHKNIAPEIQRPMLEFILSADGPWGKGWEHCSVLRDEENDGYPVGILLRNVNETNIKVFTNGIIATRFSTGWGSAFFFNRFTQAGFTDNEALLLASMFTWGGMRVNTGQNYESMFSSTPYKKNLDLSVTKLGPASSDTPFKYGGDILFNSKCFLSSSPDWSATAQIKGSHAASSYENSLARPNPCNYIWESRGNAGLTKRSLHSDVKEGFVDPFKLKDFLLIKEMKNPDARVSEVRDAFKLAEKEAIEI